MKIKKDYLDVVYDKKKDHLQVIPINLQNTCVKDLTLKLMKKF